VRSDIDKISMRMDVDGLRRGYYADPPYLNIVSILNALAYSRNMTPINALTGDALSNFDPSNAIVETHWIVRRRPFTVVAGMPRVLAILRECSGYFHSDSDEFVNTSGEIQVEAVDDGTIIEYDGNPSDALPVLVVRGQFKDFALLKTPILGTLSRASRIATNVYHMLDAAKGKPVFFFSARYDPPEVQALDGYAYHVAVKRYNIDTGYSLPDAVSTYANTEWWGGTIEGTISHEAIACFLGDSVQLMLRFAEILPPERIRVALVDFNNDCVTETKKVMNALFERFRLHSENADPGQAARYKLHGVRVDTSKELVDKSLSVDASSVDYGVSPRLIKLLRQVINNEWENWGLPASWHDRARQWCSDVKIMVSGGFTADKISSFERQHIPVDYYGVGSALLANCPENGNLTDYSSVLMKVQVDGYWRAVAKAGRNLNSNPALTQHVF